ncbi:hypothetical protein C3Y87_03520 [Carbonactinospora thermoautotrophica]|nr:hypothetical protein [Carbonactinospora thermoautotrophica]
MPAGREQAQVASQMTMNGRMLGSWRNMRTGRGPSSGRRTRAPVTADPLPGFAQSGRYPQQLAMLRLPALGQALPRSFTGETQRDRCRRTHSAKTLVLP